MDLPSICIKGLPGKRDEANRAGIMPILLIMLVKDSSRFLGFPLIQTQLKYFQVYPDIISRNIYLIGPLVFLCLNL
jgi:hypothetical protein